MKARLFIFIALVLGLVSCQNEPDEMNVSLGGEQEVMLTVSLPEATRADSAVGALDNSVLTEYDLRYILEVYYGENCNRFVQTSTSTSAVFPVRLAPGRTYTFVVWADFVTKGADAENDIDLFYETSAGLKAIQIIEDKWAPMVEARDAYVGSKTIADFQTSSNLEMTLTRPFAKVRVVSTDIEQLRGVGIVPTTAQATYSQNMYRKFNAATGVASDAATKTHTFAYANVDSYEANTDSKLTIFSDYIFVPAEGVAKFTLEVWDGETTPRSIKQNNFNTDIFVEENKVTSIVGDVLTTGGNVKVTIDGELGEKETITVVDNAQSLQDAINNAPAGEETTIELGGDIDLGSYMAGLLSVTRASEPAYALLVDAGKEVALDLKGFTISYAKAQTSAFSMIQNRGKLTIMDSSEAKTGRVAYADNGQGGNYVSNTIGNSGELIIDGATIENNSSALVAQNGYPHPIDNNKKLVINGGTITNNANYSSMRIWCTTDDDTEVTINGGEFNGSIDFQTVNGNANKGVLTINDGVFNADSYTNCAVRLLGFGVDVDEMFGYINGGTFNGDIKLRNFVGGSFNSNVFNIKGGVFSSDPSQFVNDDYKVVEENGVWTVKMTEETKLRKVLAEGGEVTLEENITIAAQLEVTTTEAIVVNGNNKTIYYTGSDRAFNVNGLATANVTLNDLTFVNDASYCQRGINFNVAGKLTLNNVTVGESGTPATYAINLPGSSGGAEVVINDSYFRGNIALNVWGENAKINATGSEFVSYDGAEHENYAAISLNNDGSTIANGTTIHIDGGKVIALDEKGEPSYAVRNSTNTGEVTISDSTEVVGTVANPVAAVIYEGYNEFYSFTTLKAAIDKAIETKGSVRLIKDIEVDETITIPAEGNVTIDLNGRNITSNIAGKPSESFALFSVNGNLEIKGNGTISLTSEDFEWNTSYRYTAINIRETGVVTLGNGVSVICEASKDGSYGMSYAVDIYTTGTLNINGASLHSNYIAVRCFFGNSVVYVNSGSKITSSRNNYGIWLQSSPGAVVTIADDVDYTFENNIYCFN